jgi:hypothetical protein
MPVLEFDPVRHRYKLDDKPAPGVTTIMGGGIPKPALYRWYAEQAAIYVEQNPGRVEELREAPPVTKRNGKTVSALVHEVTKAPEIVRDQAALRGTEIHALADRVAHGEAVEVPAQHAKEVAGYAEWLDSWKVTTLLTERPCFSRNPRWCGTFDILFTSPYINDGNPVMGDVKTSKRVYGETAVQTGVYSRAEGYLDHDGEVQALPEITYTGVMHVTADGTQFHPLNTSAAEIDEVMAWFAAIYTTHTNANNRDKRLRPPLVKTPTEFYNTLKTGEAA